MNAFELLKTDHQKVSALFKEIEAASGQSKKGFFAQLKSELDLHAQIEEAIFYPALENKSEAREITLEAYEEHNVVKDLLAELAAARSADDEWDAKLTVLKENVEHHVEEEEGELFSKAEDALGDEEIERLGDEMAAEKARAQGLTKQAAKRPTKAAAKTRARATKDSGKKTGIMGTLANRVGPGSKTDSSAATITPSRGRSSQKAGAKKSADKKASSRKSATAAKPTSQKRGAKKAAAKSSAKKSGAKKASVNSRTTAQKAVRSASSRKSPASRKSGGAKKVSVASKAGARKSARKR